jgi:hypothetical protein
VAYRQGIDDRATMHGKVIDNRVIAHCAWGMGQQACWPLHGRGGEPWTLRKAIACGNRSNNKALLCNSYIQFSSVAGATAGLAIRG